MDIGLGIPQDQIGTDPAFLRDYLQTVEGLGYSHIVLLEHVLSTLPYRPGGSAEAGPPAFHEPLTFLAWAAAQTTRLGLMTGILILPQRQTVLVAKQAAEVDLLSGGRLRLGVAVGWNQTEYEGLGVDFHTRGRRLDAQIELLRRLWSEPAVDVHDGFHTIDRAGINPRPTRQIPIWVGGMSDRALQRAARLADGWYPMSAAGPTAETEERLARLRDLLIAAGRDPAAYAIEARVNFDGTNIDAPLAQARRWRRLGATHFQVTTRRAADWSSGIPFTMPEHIDAIRRFKQAWDESAPTP
jgi:probable F420-dependent oxidoreductase